MLLLVLGEANAGLADSPSTETQSLEQLSVRLVSLVGALYDENWGQDCASLTRTPVLSLTTKL
jgi:hypothetical protein